MTTINEGIHTAEFLGELAMGPGYHIDEVTLASGENLDAGAVLGTITASGKYAEYDNSADTGIETASGILFAAVDASAGDVTNARVLRRGPAMVNKNDLGFASDQDAAAQTAALADLLTLGIKAA